MRWTGTVRTTTSALSPLSTLFGKCSLTMPPKYGKPTFAVSLLALSPSSTDSLSFTSWPWRASFASRFHWPWSARPSGAPAEADGAVGQHDLARLVERDGLPLGIVRLAELAVEVGRADVAVGHHDRLAARQLVLLQHHEHRHVGVAPHVVVEVRAALAAAVGKVELLQDHVAHRHRDRGVGALLRVHPDVGQLGDLGVVGRHRDRLGALVADLGEEVRVGRARLRHVAAPRDDEVRVVPVGRLGHVGLLAPDLRGRRRQVAVPVVEAHAHAADEAQVPAAGRIADHRHRRDRREADHAVGAVLLDRVDVGGRDDLVDLVPARAHEAAQAAHASGSRGAPRRPRRSTPTRPPGRARAARPASA